MARKFIQGNEAIAQGALDAGMKFYAGYPITPASEIMESLVDKDISFLQAEDEIASVNLCLGASLAGEKSMTATSGPGFSLMQEGIGFGHMTRTPMVLVNVQRVGPSTGMPTFASQGDILQTKYGSHGDYCPIVFYPNSVKELYEYTIHSFNASEESKTPVILLSDEMISHMYESVELSKVNSIKRKDKPLGENNKHVTGLLSKGNIPKTKDFDYYKEWFEDYQKEVLNVAKNYEFYEYIENKKADELIIAYGIVSRTISGFKDKYSIFRPIRLFPVLEKQIKEIANKYKKVIVVEMNNGQYSGELKKILGKKVESISILDGKINLDEVREKLK